MKFTQLTETVSKRPIPPHATHLIAEAMVCDEEGEDVDVCHLRFTHSVIGANHGPPRFLSLSSASEHICRSQMKRNVYPILY